MAPELLLYVLSVETQGLSAQVRVNDITVYTNSGTQAAFSEKINPLLAPGENLVTVSLGLPAPVAIPPQAPPGRAPAPPPARPSFRLRIQRGVQGIEPGPEGILVEYRWAAATVLEPGRLAEVFRRTFDPGPIPRRPLWSTLPAVPVAAGELTDLVLRYANALRERDVDFALELNQPKLRDLAAALDLDANEIISNFRASLQSMMAAPGWSVAPVEVKRLQFLPEAGSRMIRIALEDGSPPIMATTEGRQIPFAMTVSRLDHRWYIVR